MADQNNSELDVRLEALKSDFEAAIRSKRLRRQSRRRAYRAGVLSVGALLALSGTAFAAGNALGVINLGEGNTATALATVPVLYPWHGHGYVVQVKPKAPYAYHLVDGKISTNSSCMSNPLYANMWVESRQPLSEATLREILTRSTAAAAAGRPQPEELFGPDIVSIGTGCPTGAAPEAPASVEAEALAEGWDKEKSMEGTSAWPRSAWPPREASTSHAGQATTVESSE